MESSLFHGAVHADEGWSALCPTVATSTLPHIFYVNHNDRKTCVTAYINTHYEPTKQTPADVAILMMFSVFG